MPGFKITTTSARWAWVCALSEAPFLHFIREQEQHIYLKIIFWGQMFRNSRNSLFLFTLVKPQGDKYSPDEIK